MESQTTSGKKISTPGQIAATVVGAALGYYCGLMILIPGGGAMIVLLLARRVAPKSLKPFGAAIAVIFGHLAWMLVGALLLRSGLSALIFDLAAMVIGMLWLLLRPGIGPVILLCAYEAFSLVVNIINILTYKVGTVGHKALAAHIALRLFAIAALIAGYRQFRRNEPRCKPLIPAGIV